MPESCLAASRTMPSGEDASISSNAMPAAVIAVLARRQCGQDEVVTTATTTTVGSEVSSDDDDAARHDNTTRVACRDGIPRRVMRCTRASAVRAA